MANSTRTTLSVARVQFEVIRAPAHVGAQRHHHAVVGSTGTKGGVWGQRQPVHAHDPQHALAVDGRLASGPSYPVHERRDAPVSIGWARIDDLADGEQESSVLRLAVGTARPSQPGPALGEIGAGDAERVSNGLHGEPIP
jgi:hypothetical protein